MHISFYTTTTLLVFLKLFSLVFSFRLPTQLPTFAMNHPTSMPQPQREEPSHVPYTEDVGIRLLEANLQSNLDIMPHSENITLENATSIKEPSAKAHVPYTEDVGIWLQEVNPQSNHSNVPHSQNTTLNKESTEAHFSYTEDVGIQLQDVHLQPNFNFAPHNQNTTSRNVTSNEEPPTEVHIPYSEDVGVSLQEVNPQSNHSIVSYIQNTTSNEEQSTEADVYYTEDESTRLQELHLRPNLGIVPHTQIHKTEALDAANDVQRRQVANPGLYLPNGPPQRFQRLRKPSPDFQRLQNEYLALNQVRPQVHVGEKSQNSTVLDPFGSKRPHGASHKFCSMFGCDCTPPPNAKCCLGYRYDRRSKQCKQLH